MKLHHLLPLGLLATATLLPSCHQQQPVEKQVAVNEMIMVPPVPSAPLPRAYESTVNNTPVSDAGIASSAEGESYAKVPENSFLSAKQAPLSTFSIDVDPASYSNVRRFLTENNALPPAAAVRTEELINYFHYDYPAAPANVPCTLTTEVATCPWNAQHQLALVGVQGRDVPTDQLPPANLVFLLDVSGSMDQPDKLPLLKESFRLLVKSLRPQDYISIVVYAGAAGLVLPPTPGSEPETILEALDKLEAGGSTAGGEGIRLAYEVARQNFRTSANNRVVLATDGDFNVGEQSEEALEQLITQQRQSGIFLSVLGFGEGNLQDSKMELLADKGNGNYAYIDNLSEGRRVLVQQFGGTLFTLAKDVKIQVEFNPARVREYRLIGYENRMLKDEDFNNDRKDAGELGAGQQVTALYEIVPVDAPPTIDKLKYQSTVVATPAANSADIMTVKLRYQEPQGHQSQLLARELRGAVPSIDRASDNLRFAAAVAQFGMLLRQSDYRGQATYANTTDLASSARRSDPDGYRAQFLELVRKAADLSVTTATTETR
ncbi:VWA domain-containing protein [Hymenobacter sp. GOD-10R]|uniref:vWA domain-containing protein n=1 Tax=Hymenobacter sp. GOD-10R TaxID=3093922 RepID=UPI002D789310|nr:VWA domain-containing protein [Hymenobacter sp. GOD-10R]WRQ28631.1 VWA domain-containing protein [Hymenobacter sp. GOD-10R]